ncbi:hypothetical protein KLO14_18615 [Clostridioides difficile]|nr:hypothetical protein [Clostridioides difficile]
MNIVYSIDMVKMRVRVFQDDFKEFFSQFNFEPNVDYKFMTSIKSYRHNYYFKDCVPFGNPCSFWVGCGHNSQLDDLKIDIVIEFNPNKCEGSSILEFILDRFYYNNPNVEVLSFDLACDIPVNITNLMFSKGSQRNYKMFSKSFEDKTHYFGVRGSEGYLKVYNKAKELKLKNQELTRYEITFKPCMPIQRICRFFNVDTKYFVPVYYIDNFQMSLDIDGTDKVLLFSCMEHPEFLEYLGRRKRKKIEQLLADNCSLKFDFSAIDSVISMFFNCIYDTELRSIYNSNL